MITTLVHTATTTTVGSPLVNMAIFLAFVAGTMVIVIRASKSNTSATDYYTGGRSFTGGQNGTAIAGDYLSAASFLGITGAIALTGFDGFLYSVGFLVGLAGRPAARRRAAAQHRQVHDGRRARVPDAPAPGAHRGRDLHPGCVVLLPPGPDGRCRWAGQPPAGHHRRRRPVDHDRRRRHPDDRLRPRRRHEGHHLGADHQGRPAHLRRRPHDLLGAEQVRVLPVQRDGRRRRQQPAGRQAPRIPAPSTARPR